MQSKGAIRLVTILLVIACVWQLSFSVVTRMQNNKAENHKSQSNNNDTRCKRNNSRRNIGNNKSCAAKRNGLTETV